MNRNSLRDFCLSLTAAVEEFPFGIEVAVFKVQSKMFALLPVGADPVSISLKCDPVEAVMLREMYDAVQPGYHLNKKHWNTVLVDGEIPDDRIYEMIEDSYTLIRKKLPKRERQALDMLEQNDPTRGDD